VGLRGDCQPHTIAASDQECREQKKGFLRHLGCSNREPASDLAARILLRLLSFYLPGQPGHSLMRDDAKLYSIGASPYVILGIWPKSHRLVGEILRTGAKATCFFEGDQLFSGRCWGFG